MIPDGQNGAETMEWYEDNRPETPLDIALADSGTANLQARCILSGVPEPHFEPTSVLYSEIGTQLLSQMTTSGVIAKIKHFERILAWAARPNVPPDIAFFVGAKVMRLASDEHREEFLDAIISHEPWANFRMRFNDTPMFKPLYDYVFKPR